MYKIVLLDHLSYAQDELLWSLFIRRLSVHLSPCPLTLSNDNSSKAIDAICP